MNGLGRELQTLAAWVEWPETPDVAPIVMERLAVPPPPRVRRAARRTAIAVALALVATTLAVLAVPPARTAVLDWLGVGGARIVRVDELPSLTPARDLRVLGARTTLEAARAQAGFRFADPPDGETAPDEVRVARGLRVSYVWLGGGGDVRLLVTQFPGSVGDPALLKKLAGESTVVERLEVDGDAAVWLEGGPHVALFLRPDGLVGEERGWLAGNTLLVDRDGTTVRVEGAVERSDAVDLVRAMRTDHSFEG